MRRSVASRRVDAELGRLALDKYQIPIRAPDLTDNSLIRIGADPERPLPVQRRDQRLTPTSSAWQGAIAKGMGDPNLTAFTPDVDERDRTGSDRRSTMLRQVHPSHPLVTTLSQGLDKIMPDASQVLTDAELEAAGKRGSTTSKTAIARKAAGR